MVELSVEARALVELGRALRKEADGKELRRDLIRNLKTPLAPALAEIKAGVLSMSSGGLPRGGESLRRAVARKIRSEAKLSGYSAGVRIRARKTPTLRGFRASPKRINSADGWRHPVFGRDQWAHQIGKPGFFDDPLRRRKPEFRRAVVRTMDETARRISVRIKL